MPILKDYRVDERAEAVLARLDTKADFMAANKKDSPMLKKISSKLKNS